jgi:4-hydroxy-tetrahydrodipicolinate reductase
MTNIMINGALGRMGSEAVKAVTNDSDLNLVGTCDADDDLVATIQASGATVVIDFTTPEKIFETIQTILNAGCFAVVGTTGLTDDQLKTLDALATANQVAVAICPNFAIGAVLMMQFSAQAAKYFPNTEIIEYHHNNKVDAPSGTAIKTADMIAEQNKKASFNDSLVSETELIKGARGGRKHNIPIHSVRLPGYIAHQEVIFGGLGQTLIIRHDTISRESFMPGVVLVTKQIMTKTGLIYGLEHFL